MEAPIEIIFEDEHLLAVNKPAGLLTIRDGYDAALPYITRLLEPAAGRLWVVHRLDRDTSGVLILARSQAVHRSLNLAFAGRQVIKHYHAIAAGTPTWAEKTVDLPLKVDGDRRHRTVAASTGGKPAQTELRVLLRGEEYTLIEAHPITGYTHQIRAHLAATGFPILSDALYAPKTGKNSVQDLSLIQRLALHAYSIQFQHPVTFAPLSLIATYPLDFKQAVDKIFHNNLV